MASYYSIPTKNIMLDSIVVNKISLHTGNPGATGAAPNEYAGTGYARQDCVFAAAADGKRLLDECVIFSGDATDSISWLGFWAGSTFRGAAPAAGTTTFDECGLLMVLKEDTYLSIEDEA